MTAVVLRPLGDAVYEIARGTDRWVHGPIVIGRNLGWDVRTRGLGPRVKHFDRLVEARKWLDSPEGGRWLDSLAAEVPR